MRLGLDGKDPKKVPKLVVKLEIQHILKLLFCFEGAFLHVDDVSESMHLEKETVFFCVSLSYDKIMSAARPGPAPPAAVYL